MRRLYSLCRCYILSVKNHIFSLMVSQQAPINVIFLIRLSYSLIELTLLRVQLFYGKMTFGED